MLNFLHQQSQDMCPMCGDVLTVVEGFILCNSCGFPIEVDAE